MSDVTLDYAARPHGHAMAGGLFNLYCGVFGLTMSLALWLTLTNPNWQGHWYDALLLLPAIALGPIYARARARYVYPRLGYVVPQRRPAAQTLALIAVICAVSAAAAFILAQYSVNITVIRRGSVLLSNVSDSSLGLLFTGTICAAAYAAYAWQHRQALYLRFAAVYMLSASVLAVLHLSYLLGAVLFLTIIAVAHLIAGGIEFRELLRMPAISAETAE